MKECIDQYNIVFNADGTNKLTGRVECQKLIELCEKYGEEGVDYGNVDTGFVKAENIRALFESRGWL